MLKVADDEDDWAPKPRGLVIVNRRKVTASLQERVPWLPVVEAEAGEVLQMLSRIQMLRTVRMNVRRGFCMNLKS